VTTSEERVQLTVGLTYDLRLHVYGTFK